ncbi:hypothetical protein Btru_071165 [Bulinus truncatus]|nr:hypothetical protein Btru_071165 [Bulinus truncatus]
MNVRQSHGPSHSPPASISHEPQGRAVRCTTCPGGQSYPMSPTGRDLNSGQSSELEKRVSTDFLPVKSGTKRQEDSARGDDLELNELLLSLQMLSRECDIYCRGGKSNDDGRDKNCRGDDRNRRKMPNGGDYLCQGSQHRDCHDNSKDSTSGVCGVTIDNSNNNNNNNNNSQMGECQNTRCTHPLGESHADRPAAAATPDNGLTHEVGRKTVDENKTHTQDRPGVYTSARHIVTICDVFGPSPGPCVVRGCAKKRGSLAELVDGMGNETETVTAKVGKSLGRSELGDANNSGGVRLEDVAESFGNLRLFQADVLTVLTSSLCDDLKLDVLSCRDVSDSAVDVKHDVTTVDLTIVEREKMKDEENVTEDVVDRITMSEVAGRRIANSPESGKSLEVVDDVAVRHEVAASPAADEKPKEKRKHRRSKRSYQRSRSLHRERSLEKHADEAPEGSDLGGSLRELAHLNIDVCQQLVDGKRVFTVKDASPELQVIVNSLTPVLSRRSRSRRSGHYTEHAHEASIPTAVPEARGRVNFDETAHLTSSGVKGTSSVVSSEKLSPLDSQTDAEHGHKSARCTSSIGSDVSNQLIDQTLKPPSFASSTRVEAKTHSGKESFSGLVGRVSGARDDLTLDHHDDLQAELAENKNSLFMSPKLSRTWHGTSDLTRRRGGPNMGVGLTTSDSNEGSEFSARGTPRGSPPSKETAGGSSPQQHAQTLPIISRTLLDAMHKRYCAHQYSNNYQTLQPFTMLRLDPASTTGNQPITALRIEPCSVRGLEVHVAPPSPQFIARLRQLNSEFKANRSGGGQHLHPRPQPPTPHQSPEPPVRVPRPQTPPRMPQTPARGSPPDKKAIQPPRFLHLTPDPSRSHQTDARVQGSPCEVIDQDGGVFVDATPSGHFSESSPLVNKASGQGTMNLTSDTTPAK